MRSRLSDFAAQTELQSELTCNEINQLKGDLEVRDAEVHSLSSQLHEVSTSLQLDRDRLQVESAARHQAESSHQEATAIASELTARNERLQSSLDLTTAQNEDLTMDKRKLEQSNAELRDQVDELLKQAKQQREQAKMDWEKSKEQEAKIIEMSSRIGNMERYEADLNQALDSTKLELTSALRQLEVRDRQLRELSGQMDALQETNRRTRELMTLQSQKETDALDIAIQRRRQAAREMVDAAGQMVQEMSLHSPRHSPLPHASPVPGEENRGRIMNSLDSANRSLDAAFKSLDVASRMQR
jgi:chromosome segregation ATPase